MKVLFIAPRFHTNLYNSVKSLQSAGHTVRVLVLYKGVSEFYEGVDLRVLGYSKISSLLSSLFSKRKKTYLKSTFELKTGFPSFLRLKREIDEFGPDFMILKAYQDALSSISLLFGMFKGLKTTLLVQTKKNHVKGNRTLLKAYLWLIRKMGVVAYISPILETKRIFNDIEIDNVYYIPFVFPVKEFDRDYFRDGKVDIMMVGKFVQRKELLLLIKAFEKLLHKGHGLRLNVFGEKADLDYYNEVKRYIDESKLQKKVTLNCDVRHGDVLREYRKNDLFVLPSSAEPAAYSIVEAMANKLPVICSDECGTRCYIENGKNGYIFKSKDLTDLEKNIEMIVSSRRLLTKMGSKGFEIVKLKHNERNFVQLINKIMKSHNIKR